MYRLQLSNAQEWKHVEAAHTNFGRSKLKNTQHTNNTHTQQTDKTKQTNALNAHYCDDFLEGNRLLVVVCATASTSVSKLIE